MNDRRANRHDVLVMVTLMSVVSAPLSGHAQQQAPSVERQPAAIHWAYSSFLGTGFYRVSGEREVFVVDMPFGWDWREPELFADGSRQWGVRFEAPVNIGVHRIDFIDDLLDIENYATVAAMPGVELELPVNEHWRLKAYGHLGYGTDLSSDERAWIWDAGLRSHRAFKSGSLDWGLFGEAFTAGYAAKDGPDGSLGGFGAGVDFRHPTVIRATDGTAMNVTWDLTWRWYADDLTFHPIAGEPTSIEDEWRVSVALARSDGPIRIWFLEFDQLGLSYRTDSDGEFRGITVNISAPFSR